MRNALIMNASLFWGATPDLKKFSTWLPKLHVIRTFFLNNQSVNF
jgi:hypothetical protein